MIDKLASDVVDSGKAHPFVIALVKDLREKQTVTMRTMESPTLIDAATRWHAGRAAALREICDLIVNAKGRDDAE